MDEHGRHQHIDAHDDREGPEIEGRDPRLERWIQMSAKLFGFFGECDQLDMDAFGESSFRYYCATGQSLQAVDTLALIGASADVEGTDSLHTTPLMILARCNDGQHIVRAVKKLLDRGASVNKTDGAGMTPLHHFSQNCFCLQVEEAIESLVQAGADLEATDQHGNTPVARACLTNNVYACNAMIKLGARVTVENRFSGHTPLQDRMQNEYVRVNAMLVNAGAGIDHLDTRQMQALFLSSVENVYENAVRRLVPAGADMEARGCGGHTALLVAASHGFAPIIRELLGFGAIIDATSDQGDTALHLASISGHLSSATELVKVGASVHAVNEDGNTALIAAAERGHHLLLSLLLEHGADTGACNKCGDYALHLAAKFGHKEACKVLLDAGANIEVLDKGGNTALAVAAQAGQGTVCCELLSRGAQRAHTVSFFKSLWNAARCGDVPTMAQLVEHGEQVNHSDSFGRTVLHAAVQRQERDAVSWLLNNGANILQASTDGLTPLHVAAQAVSESQSRRFNIVILRLLLSRGADFTALTADSRTPLDVAIQSRNQNAISILQKAQIEKDLIAAGGEATTPAMVVVRFGGPPGAGKSTITRSLKVPRWMSYFIDENEDDEAYFNMHQRTKGIDRQELTDINAAGFAIFDLGGHGEFLATHQMFIGDGTVPVIDCVVVSMQEPSPEEAAFKWCSLFASRNQPSPTPWPLLMIATRADKASDSEMHTMQRVYHAMKQTFTGYFCFPYDQPFFIDARKSWKEATVVLRHALSKLHQDLLSKDDAVRQPAICQDIIKHLPALRKKAGVPVITKDDFIAFMKPLVGLDRAQGYSDPNTPTALTSLFDKALQFLSGFATVLVFRSPQASKYVVIEPKWLLTDIVGRLMSEPPLPKPYVHYDNGHAARDDVVRVLTTSHLLGEAALAMTADLGFCLERKSSRRVLNPSKLCGYNRQWCSDTSMTVNGGRRLKCKGVVAIASAFFTHLQVHFYNRYREKYGEELPMWSGGIRLASGERGWAEALIEAHPANLSIDIIVRGRDGSEAECAELLHDLTEETLQKASKISPGSELHLFYLSRVELNALSPAGHPSHPSIEYSEQRVANALKRGQPMTDGRASSPEDPRTLLVWSPHQTQIKNTSTVTDAGEGSGADPLEPLDLPHKVPGDQWSIIITRLAKAINTSEECTALAEELSVNDREEDIVLKMRDQDPRCSPSVIAVEIFRLWLKQGGCHLPCEEKRMALHRAFRQALHRPRLAEFLDDELRARSDS